MSISHSDLMPIGFTVVVRNSDRHRIGTLIAIPRNPHIDNVRFRVAVDLAVVDPVPDLQTATSVITYPERLATGGRLVSAVSTDSAN